jgi:diguanylate cyclase
LSTRSWLVLLGGALTVAAMLAATMAKVAGEQSGTWITDIGEPVVGAIAAAVMFYAASHCGKGMLRRAWMLIALSALAFCIGDIIWAWIELGQGVEVPYPGLPDVFYVLQYPLLFAGLTTALWGYRELLDLRRPIALGAVLAAVLGLIVFFGFLRPLVLETDASVAEKAISTFYPLADVFFAFAPALALALAVARMGVGRLAWPWLAVAAGVVLFAAADGGYAFLSARNLYQSGNLVDFGWALGQVLLAFGASITLDLAWVGRRSGAA